MLLLLQFLRNPVLSSYKTISEHLYIYSALVLGWTFNKCCYISYVLIIAAKIVLIAWFANF
jgi:hypothetical protein